jgi:hypothetical protein
LLEEPIANVYCKNLAAGLEHLAANVDTALTVGPVPTQFFDRRVSDRLRAQRPKDTPQLQTRNPRNPDRHHFMKKNLHVID